MNKISIEDVKKATKLYLSKQEKFVEAERQKEEVETTRFEKILKTLQEIDAESKKPEMSELFEASNKAIALDQDSAPYSEGYRIMKHGDFNIYVGQCGVICETLIDGRGPEMLKFSKSIHLPSIARKLERKGMTKEKIMRAFHSGLNEIINNASV
jgi:hypothetical protein